MNRIIRATVLSLVFTLGFAATPANAQPTAFTYQGSLSDNGGLADGTYDFEFTVHSALTGGTALGTDEHLGVQVLDGLFTATLDFGISPFSTQSNRYLQVAVRFDGDPTYTPLDPRIQLNSVPYAIRANTANYAISGPFAPIDTTPASTSGLGNTVFQRLSYTLDINGQQFPNAQAIFPITISRLVIDSGLALSPGNFNDFEIEFSTPFDPANNWQSHFDQAIAPVTIEIITQDISTTDQTVFKFDDGVVSGYRLTQNGSNGLNEVITINYGKPSQNNIPLRDYADRDSINTYSEPGHGPFSPYLGGSAILPGIYTYSYDGFIPPHSSIGSLPAESRFIIGGNPTNSTDSQLLTMLHNVYADRFDTIWGIFADTSQPQPVELRDPSGIIWQSPAESIIKSWTLDIADDGGLFESYDIQYLE